MPKSKIKIYISFSRLIVIIVIRTVIFLIFEVFLPLKRNSFIKLLKKLSPTVILFEIDVSQQIISLNFDFCWKLT